MSEAPERIWVWGWRADSVWQEQTWQHEDEPMSTMEYVRVDLVEAAEQRGYANAMEAERKLHEARIEELEAKHQETFQMYVDANEARIDAEAQAAEIERLRGDLAKAVDALEAIYEITVEPAETDHKNVRGWIEVTARNTLSVLTGDKT